MTVTFRSCAGRSSLGALLFFSKSWDMKSGMRSRIHSEQDTQPVGRTIDSYIYATKFGKLGFTNVMSVTFPKHVNVANL